jgi:hypothetical protein
MTASQETAPRVWDAKTGAEILMLGGQDARGMDILTPEGRRNYSGHTSAVGAAAFSADGSRIVTASQDQTAKVWDATTGAVIATLKGQFGISSAEFSPDGSRVVTGGMDGTVRIWDAKSGAEVLMLRSRGVRSASFSADGSRIVTAGSTSGVTVWDARPHWPMANRTRPEWTRIERDGVFGFPQAQAQILCDQRELRVSVWNNAEHLYVQAIVWQDSEGVQKEANSGRLVATESSVLTLDVDGDGQDTPRVDRDYWLSNASVSPGLCYTFALGRDSSKAPKQKSDGRGAIQYVDAGAGQRVRVDSFVIPLSELRKRPGTKIGLVYWAYSSPWKPSLRLNSVGAAGSGGVNIPANFPKKKYDSVTLSERKASFDLGLVPEEPETPTAAPRGAL